jgi:glycosyltransferase involved in cell wall biosynthesis
MKVVHIITDLLDGGAEAILYRLIVATKNQVCHHVIVLMDPAKYGPMIEAAGVRVDALDMPRGRVTPRGIWHLFSLLRASQGDVIQTWMYHGDLIGGAVARLAGHSSIAWGVHHSELDSTTMAFSTRMVVRACAMLSHVVPQRIVSCSQAGARIHRDIGYADKFSVVANGYDTEAFRPNDEARARLRAQWRVPSGAPLIGLVGRLHPSKDHRNLLKALARVRITRPDVRCVLVGAGCDPAEPQLREMIDELRLADAVILLGQRNDVPSIMNALDVHVLSSTGEAFPNVVAEAMASGTPCVVTNVGDAALIVGPTGITVPPRDPEALAAAIGEILDERKLDSQRWQARRHAARDRIVENFSLPRMAIDYRRLWANLAENKGMNDEGAP